MADPDEDRVCIVCAPWSEAQLMQLPGNRTAVCDGCNEPVVISKQGRKMQAEETRPVVLFCLRCARREAPDSVMEIVPGAVEAAEAAGVRPGMSRALAGMKLRDMLDDEGKWL